MALPMADIQLSPSSCVYGELERAVLGEIMNDFEKVWPGVSYWPPEVFDEPRHRIVFQAIKERAENGEGVDVHLVGLQLQATGKLETVGGSLYLLDCAEMDYVRAKFSQYVVVLADRYHKKLLTTAASEVISDATKPNVKLREMASRLDDALSLVRRNSALEWPRDSSAVMKEAINLLESRKRNRQDILYTGFAWPDTYLNGFEPGHLILVGGRPSMGKTSLGMNICEHIAKSGHPVGIISLEMPRAELGVRLLAKRTRISVSELRGIDDSPELWQKVNRAKAELGQLPIHYGSGCEVSGSSLDRVINEIHRLVRDCGCRLVMVDYIGLISPGSKMPPSQNQWISFVSQRLKMTARGLNVPLLCLSQLNRAPETRNDPRPLLADLRDSGSLEQDADEVLFVYRPWFYVSEKDVKHQEGLRRVSLGEKGKKMHEYTTEDKAEIIVAKNRNGPTGSAWLKWEPEHCAFSNLTFDEPTL